MINTNHSFTIVYAAVVVLYCYAFANGLDDIYYLHNNMSCLKCQPGTYWVAHCTTDGGSAVCKPCAEGTFTAKYNLAWSCQKCRSSCRNTNHGDSEEQREEVAHNCTSTSDLLCRCRTGLWREPGTNGACRFATSCGLGSGVLTIASETSDTVCVACTLGETFSNSTSKTEQCLACSICGADQTIQRLCTKTEDTICAAKNAKNADQERLNIGLGVGVPVFLITCGIACGFALRAYRRSRNAHADQTSNHNGQELNRLNGVHRDAFEMEHLAEQVDDTESHGTNAKSNHGQNHTVDERHLPEPDDASNPDLFMQKVYTDLSKVMDGNYQPFFRRNNISENIISVIETEERRVRERCYKLFLVLGGRQPDVRTLPSNEIPLEIIRRFRNMFQEDSDLMCAPNCLDILDSYEQTWAQINSMAES
ncbi:uncharacterized protein LOC127845062 isoform X2 [Dreissena polymorpha]|uniref:TNFR-Cys domain-containing protein n=2 Tax=Dreissena polymorpha TaxID=45954 RepID=A0A9D4EFE4_DREPO|nr:uncharacterized protein LOC127845062 isoform X2 [Dreissena polymorpha]XP_052231684.1 uncharacterized protein LOC127845062 isoform X2 [Dreissena polymorpha]XP_052231685.1 uncharacterized protein LOC127845062 isoform X2 [Dreissena polymorpha]XP_052231686.1 uncharacterized protein LOC127845062 isoform X2 [Dreissena polymorpha]XP_052231687.1 uncharacterized protein LOC127845062 isoform X2 [Dreissena polymorpha]KAH3778495.1 hypothetical protein DPMN_179955 [Dreissena polymorpha]